MSDMTIAASAPDTNRTPIERTVVHDSFTLERTYPHAPETVFAAWAIPDRKEAWFGQGPDFVETVEGYELDFRVGGRERYHGLLESGRTFGFDATFRDIVDGRRIVCAYDVLIAGRVISVTLLTVEFEPAGTGTHLVLTEQCAFLDGLDSLEDRLPGVEDMLLKLDAYLATIGSSEAG
jgi:uncharacterized protein YndB with AHSA1/START domain